MHDKYRERHFQPAIELSTGSPKEELEKSHKELKGFAAPQEEQKYESPSIPRASWDKIIKQRVHMELLMAPDAYLVEDGLVRYQREEKPSALERLDAVV